MMRLWRGLAALIAAFVMLTAPLYAQDTAPERAAQKSPFGIAVPQVPADRSIMPEAREAPGLFQRIGTWVLNTQQQLNRQLAAAVRQLKTENPLLALGTLIGIAFAYGVLHAAGPGHGKAVISSYVLANNETLRRGVALSFLSAAVQALTAIIFVGVLAIVLRQTSPAMRAAENWVETVSWALVAMLGLFLIFRQVRGWVRDWSARDAAHAQVHGGPASGAAHHHHDQHDHHHTHSEDCGCGHAHIPSPDQLKGAWSWKKALPLALTVGIRPCSGAILILIFALSQGVLWAGVLATIAMALGTAITVSMLAVLAVGSRDWAARLPGSGSVWAGRIHTATAFAGSFLVFALGTAFFFASLKAASPF